MNVPRVLVAGLRGGSGKTLISLGLVGAWRGLGRKVAPFKKGPDYIDAAWLTVAADRPCRNLDQFLMPDDRILRSLATAVDADVAVIEGNRGLFDGVDARGSYSTAELAKLLQSPVLLVVDCTKATRTVAAQVLGCMTLDPEVHIGGVVLNRSGGSRHENVVREAIEKDCGLDVLGVVRRSSVELFPERHLGLLPPEEHAERVMAVQRATEIVEHGLDLDAIWRLSSGAPRLQPPAPDPTPTKPQIVRIGIFQDAAFSFYYPDNLEALEREGAQLVEVSPLRERELPPVDGLYIGGGFPEVLAPELAKNRPFRESVRRAAEGGLPVYAECGGAIYLGEELLYEGSTFEMCGVLPVSYAFSKKPRGHGYTELETVHQNPFFQEGELIRGHEFHYTYLDGSENPDLTYAFTVHRGEGFGDSRDGICLRNVLASYTHIHSGGTTTWAPTFVRACADFSDVSSSREYVGR